MRPVRGAAPLRRLLFYRPNTNEPWDQGDSNTDPDAAWLGFSEHWSTDSQT
jgi:hypothetical protein